MKKTAWVATLGLAALLCAGFAAAPAGAQTAQEAQKQKDELRKRASAAKSPDEQIRLYTEYIRRWPNEWLGYSLRAGVYDFTKKQYDPAIADYTRALQVSPKTTHLLWSRARAYMLKGSYDPAIADYTAYIQRTPRSWGAHLARAWPYFKKRQYDLAKADFEKALQLGPEEAEVNARFASFLATCPGPPSCRDGKRAVELALKGVRLKYLPPYLGTLAAAYAEAGRWEEAVRTQEQTLSMLRERKAKAEAIARAEKRLALYKQRKPDRQVD